MIKLKINDQLIEVKKGATLLEAAKKAGFEIPTMCFKEGYTNHPSCMVCVVKDQKTSDLLTSCAYIAQDGMEIITDDTDVHNARKQALEMLLSDHVGDCEAPCTIACPAGMDIPLMNRLIGAGNFNEALKVVKKDIALPHILGYICPAPCENACRRKQIDDPVSICLLKRFAAAEGNNEKTIVQKAESTGKKIAIIGSGPAGLTAAYYLQIYGHACTVFEKSEKACATLREVISEEDMPPEVIDNEVSIIESIGVSFQYNSLITKEVFNEKIKPKFDAVIIATGDIHSDKTLIDLFEKTDSGIAVNSKDMTTSIEGVFVCGSAIKPQKMAIRSTAQAKTAAMSAHFYLQDQTWEKPSRKFNSRFNKLLDKELPEYLKEATDSKRIDPKVNPKAGFTIDEAKHEAERCLHCDCRKKDNCKLRDYADEYHVDSKHYKIGERKLMTKQIQHDLVIYEPEKCIKCGLCVEISNRENEKFGLAFEGRGIDVTINAPLGSKLNESLIHSAIKCAEACPTGAISLKEKY
jgi:NADPH-dependent glutamate synthase beta subunit-like oxidoreductase/ferredoxin